jgi:hypothetical protein
MHCPDLVGEIRQRYGDQDPLLATTDPVALRMAAEVDIAVDLGVAGSRMPWPSGPISGVV